MPVYEYKCTICDQLMEFEQSFSDSPRKTAAGCEVANNGKHKLKKVFSAVGISFKGDGFYRNDARPSSSSSGSASSSGSDSKSSGDSSSTSESKSSDSNGASKPDSKASSTTKKPESKTSA